MNEFDALLARAVEQTKVLGILVSAHISPHATVNHRAVTRFGCCIRWDGEYVIELSKRLLKTEERACVRALARGVFHTCPGCRNRGALWKEYAARMNGAYGYAISRTGTCETLGVVDVRLVRYQLVCERYGQGFCRSRHSSLVDHPERYRCRCSSVLRRNNRTCLKKMFPAEKGDKKTLLNRIFSIAGLPIGGTILTGLIVYVARTVDVRVLLASIQSLWLLEAALCVPLNESMDALIFYDMGCSVGYPVKLAGCFDAAYIGEFYYKLDPAGASVQLKLMYDASMNATCTASVYIWEAVANIMVCTGYVIVTLAYELFWRREGLGPAVTRAGALIALCVLLCRLALFTAMRPEPIQHLIRHILTFLVRHWKIMTREGMVGKGVKKVDEFHTQLHTLRGSRRMLADLSTGMFVELTTLFATPFFLYQELGLIRGPFWGLVLVQCLVLVLSCVIMLPGSAGSAGGSFYLFMGPLFDRHLAVELVLWRFAAFLEVPLLGRAWSVLCFAQRSAAGHGT